MNTHPLPYRERHISGAVILLSSPDVGLQVTKYVVELSRLSMRGWPAMGLKDNAVPRVALMTLKCWAITGTRTGL